MPERAKILSFISMVEANISISCVSFAKDIYPNNVDTIKGKINGTNHYLREFRKSWLISSCSQSWEQLFKGNLQQRILFFRSKNEQNVDQTGLENCIIWQLWMATRYLKVAKLTPLIVYWRAQPVNHIKTNLMDHDGSDWKWSHYSFLEWRTSKEKIKWLKKLK